jgi:SAM-dependent methyltransferase
VDNTALLDRFGSIPDEEWLGLLILSLSEPVIDGVRFPSFPDDKFQKAVTGSSGEAALREAFAFYQDMKRYANLSHATALDFGCGWGRNYRLLLRDVPTDRLLGVDVEADCVRLCQETIPMGRFRNCDAAPPLDASDGSFSVVYAYSVFSHLIEDLHRQWVAEFARLLVPNGLLIVTTLKRAHLDVWDRLSPDERVAFPAPKHERAARAYDQDEFVYRPLGGGRASYYGEAIIPPGYVRHKWPGFRLLEFAEDRGPQALIVAERI